MFDLNSSSFISNWNKQTPSKSHAEIPEKDECIIRNMAKMNIQIFSEANKSKKTPQLAKKDRSADVKYQLSRYTPAVKDVMEVRMNSIKTVYICFSTQSMAN